MEGDRKEDMEGGSQLLYLKDDDSSSIPAHKILLYSPTQGPAL